MSHRLRQYLARFVELTDQEWQALEGQLNVQAISRKEFLVREGQKATEISFVLSGSCRIFYEKDGEEWTTYFCFEDSLVAAYLSCLTGQPSTLSIQALEDCELLSFDYQTLVSLYQMFPVYETFRRKLERIVRTLQGVDLLHQIHFLRLSMIRK